VIFIQRLRADGFELVSVRGSHYKFVHQQLRRMVIVPHPKRDLPIGTVRSIIAKPTGTRTRDMPHYIALVHKDADSCYGVSFPDVPGAITAGDTIDEAIRQAAGVLEFAAEDWENPDGSKIFPAPRAIDELRSDPQFQVDAADAVIVAVPFRINTQAVA
jgi:predicted RNA binding protein YcfA (HicA-like mRNA interferase family)/predicted RNase H-like HicB family nuclease